MCAKFLEQSRAEQSRAEQSRAEQREVWLDALKGVGILLVILGHCSPAFMKYIYGFHMPLFFLISGYLYKGKQNIKTYSKRLIKRYIVPYFVLAFCMLIIETVLEKKIELIPHYIIGILYSRGSTQWMPMCSPLWFLTGLAIALFIFNLIMQVDRAWIRVFLIIICCGISYTLDVVQCFKLVWNIDTALMAVGFIGVGYLAAHKKKFIFENKWSVMLMLITIIIGMVVIYFNTDVNFDNNEHGNIVLMFIGAVSLSYSLSCLIYHFHLFTKFFTFFGKHTMFIMGFDYFSGAIGRKIMGIIGFENWLSVFCVKIIVLTVGIYLWYWIIHFIKNEKVQNLLRY